MEPGTSRRALTEQQRRAVAQREVSVLLSSGAGCGKTHVLTERYLAHLREGAEVGHIVAITFTDRAARQMRDRIRKAVVQELREADEEEAARWARHLDALQSASICTIHAFCGALLRQQAVVAGLDPHFDVLEEVLSANLRAEALTSCLQGLLTASAVAGDDLRELILLYGWKPVVCSLEALLPSAELGAWEGWLRRPAEDVAAQWLHAERAKLLSRYIEYLISANPKIARCLWLMRTTECIGPETRRNVGRLLEETPRLAQARDLAAAVKELTEAAKVGKERGKAWKTEKDYDAVKSAFEDFRKELPARLSLFLDQPEALTEAVVAGQRFLRVAAEVVRAYQARKRRAGAVDFHDLLVLARDLLRNHPEIREASQARYRHLLIDELQDTDPVQMDLVAALCGGGLTAGKLFAVGDHKQSIYRFRGADVGQFQGLRDLLPHDGRLGLTVNFRSQPAILDFVNALFTRHLQDYEPLLPHHRQLNAGPCVEFLWSPLPEKVYASEARAVEADTLARRLSELIAKGERLVVDHEREVLRPIRQGDIVLLFRAMTNVPLYEAALRRHGLDYYLVGGRAFFAQQEIYDLLNLLRALENPQDAVSLAGTLRSPFCCLSDEALYVVSRHDDGLWAGLHDDERLARLPDEQKGPALRARRCLDRWRGLKDRLSIARLLGEVLNDSGYDAALQFEFLGDRKLANLWKLLDLARTFDRSNLFGLAEFIERLGDLVRTQPREEQAATQTETADVVRLMSIHQAKGLEFPVVVVPDFNARGGGPHLPAAVWADPFGCVVRPPADETPPPFTEFGWNLWKTREAVEDWHEDLRTLYVACTRAQDYLVLSAALPELPEPDNAWMLALAERFDLRSGACLARDIPPERVPAVRVHEGGDTTPLPTAPLRPRSVPLSALCAEGSPPEGWPPPVAPLPLYLGDVRVVPVSALEGPAQPTDSLINWPAPRFARQFDAEDGSDRSHWATPRQRLGPSGSDESDSCHGVVRAALDLWDLSDPEGWREALASLGARGVGDLRQAEAMLHRFAESPVFRELQSARWRLRDVDYLLQLPHDDALCATSGGGHLHRPALHGHIDWLWQDARAGWHVLLFSETRLEQAGHGPPAGVVLAAEAVKGQLGIGPKSATVYRLADGAALRWTRAQLEQSNPREVIRVAMAGFPGQLPRE
jgi:ATP-dependent helicase/nuclease subunit A